MSNTGLHLGLKEPFANSYSQNKLVFTHLHQSPVVVHLLAGLEEVPPIGPHGGVLLCDDGCTYTSKESKQPGHFRKYAGMVNPLHGAILGYCSKTKAV